MTNTTPFFAITTVTSSVIAMYLGWALHVERARFVAAEGAPVANSTSGSPPQLQSPSIRLSKKELPRTSGEAPPPALDKQASPGPTSSARPVQLSALSRLRNRSSSAADLAYRRLELQQTYSDVVTALNLQADEASRLFDLLAQQDRNDAAWEMSSEGSGKSNQRERQRRWEANKVEQAALLGEARMADWNKYLNGLGARNEVRELRMQLADSDYPLRRDQYEPLVSLLAAEQVRHNAEREDLRRAQGDSNNVSPEQVIKYMDRRMDLIEESLVRRRRAAVTILDTEQLKRYQTMLDLLRLRSQVEYDSFVTVNAEASKGNAVVAR